MNSNNSGKSFVSKNRIFIGVGLILCAVICGFIIFPKAVTYQVKKYDVVVASKGISEADVFTDENIKLITTTDKNLAAMSLNIDDIKGKKAIRDIAENGYILKDDVKNEHIKKTKYNDIPDGKQIVSVSITSLAQDCAFQLKENDIARIFTVKEGQAYTPIELQYVQVIAVHIDTGEEITEDGKLISNKDVIPKPASISFYVSQEQAEKLVELEKANSIYFSLVCRDDVDRANVLLSEQDNLIKSKPEVKF